MNKSTLKSMSINAFNDEGWMGPTLWVYLNLIYLSKGLLIFIGSLASFQTGGKILDLIYPDVAELYIAIALSILPITLLVLFSIGKIQDYLVLKNTLIVLCMIEVICELFVLTKGLIYFKGPLPMSTVILFIVQSFLLLGAFYSNSTRMFFKQMKTKTPYLTSS